jgi:hypothetical protein
MDRATAERAVAALEEKGGAHDGRSESDRRVHVKRALQEGEPMAKAVLLQRLYGFPAPLSPLHEYLLLLIEESLLPELAHALGTRENELRARLHRGQPAFDRAAPDVAPETAAGWEWIATFQVSGGAMAIGEWPTPERDQDNLVLPCENGTWFALARADDEACHHLAIHESTLPQMEDLLRRRTRLGAVGVEGGRICIVDDAVRGDWTELHALEREDGGRGHVFDTGGDGAFEVFGTRPKETRPLVLVHIPAE